MMQKFLSFACLCISGFLGGAFASGIPNGGGFIAEAFANLNFSGNVVWSGKQSIQNSALWSSAAFTGTATDVFDSPLNAIQINQDAVQNSSGGQVEGLLVNHHFGSGAIGNRLAIDATLTLTGPTGNSNGAYVGGNFAVFALTNDGGTSLTPAGAVFGENPQCILAAGATFFSRCVGSAINTTVATGASVASKIGLQIAEGFNDAVQGTKADIGLVIGNKPGAIGWTCGFCFGTNDAVWPVTSSGTLIGTWGNSQTAPGTGSAGTSLYGIDWTQVTFAAGGAPLAMPLITPATSSTTCKAGSMEWDANFIYICTAANTWKRATLATF